MKRAAKKAAKKGDSTLRPRTDARSDVNVRAGFIRLKLRGHVDCVDVVISDGERSQLWASLQISDRDACPFIVFDGADGYCYAVKRRHLLSWHFKFDDPPVDAHGSGVEPPPDSPDETVRVWFSDGTPVVELDGEMDAPSDFHDIGPLNYIFSMLVVAEEAAYSFVDVDNDPYWFRSDEVALFAAPLHLIGPDEDEPN